MKTNINLILRIFTTNTTADYMTKIATKMI